MISGSVYFAATAFGLRLLSDRYPGLAIRHAHIGAAGGLLSPFALGMLELGNSSSSESSSLKRSSSLTSGLAAPFACAIPSCDLSRSWPSSPFSPSSDSLIGSGNGASGKVVPSSAASGDKIGSEAVE